MSKLLVVDDDIRMVRMLTTMLEAEGYSVTSAQNGQEALLKMKEDPPSLVLLDYMVPGMHGLDVLKEIKKGHGDIDVIVVTGHGSEKVAVEMMKMGASNYIQKPFSREELLRAVRHTLLSRTRYEEDNTNVRILAVNDDKAVLSFIKGALRGIGEVVVTTDPLGALTRMGTEYFDIILSDVYMPQLDGIEFLKRARVLSPGTRTIMITSSWDVDVARKAMKQGASDYIRKPFEPEELRESVSDLLAEKKRESFDRLKRQFENQELRATEQFEFTLGIVEALILALEARDHYTRGHSERVTEYSLEIGMEMGLSKREIDKLRHSARLHDLGKIGTEDTHLYKAGSLNQDETAMVARHPEIGCNILKSIRLMDEYIPGIRHHHERYDGSGYPEGLKGEAIPLIARIISAADAFDAMTSSRPYREGMDRGQALEELEKNRGIQFDPVVVDSFKRFLVRSDK
ncbi:MAG TPA: response regulator [Thermodesulfobacteriota bacterium]|nr:response regulator [Thermodesulfobacteriota bacterium]